MRAFLVDLIERMSRYDGMIASEDPTSWDTHWEARALDDPTMVPELLDANAATVDPLRRQMMVEALGGLAAHTDDGTALAALLWIVGQERELYPLSYALSAVGEVVKAEEVDLTPIYGLFSARNRHVRGMAILALERSCSSEVEGRILAHLAHARTDDDRFACVAALMSLGTEAALPALREALAAKRKEIRFAANEAIESIKMRKG